ncbi:MAG: conjugal transfer protein TraL, partial [Oscillospiraceae bacterium]|nr:conjugal transfer protein TraL [Oscillospiraceae bacterium]
IFIIPLWCAFWFAKRMKFRHFFVFPAVFSLTMFPALLAGKPVADILRVYLNQAGSSVAWQTVNYNSPSIFSLLPYQTQVAPWVPKIAILAAFLFMLAVLAVLFVRRGQADDAALTLAGAALSLGIPFFLPYMHERYFFLGGVLLAVLACARLIHTPSAAGAELASLGGYHAYLQKRYFCVLTLFGVTWAQLLEGLCMLFAVVWLSVSLIRTLWRHKN